MKALAELIMRGRLQSVLLALLFSGLPMLSWLAAAIVALVTLRKGATEGAIVLLATLLPLAFAGQTIELASVSAIVVVYTSSLVLRSTVSLSYSLLSLVIASVLLLAVYISQTGGSLDTLKQILENQLEQLSMGDSIAMERADFVHLLAVQSVSYGVGFTALIGLLLGRWWQALLYNPGGFQQEFHGLRMSPLITVALFLLSIIGLSGVGILNTGESTSVAANTQGMAESGLSNTMSISIAAIASLMTLPLLVTGAAIVHSVVKIRNANILWLIGFYITLPVTNTMVYLLVLVDGMIDIRDKISKQGV